MLQHRTARRPTWFQTGLGERELARLFVLGLGAARVVAGVLEVTMPDRFLRLLGSPQEGPVSPAWRMKGARDVALGLVTVAGPTDDEALVRWAAAAVVIDGVDGLAVALDRGRTLSSPLNPLGAVLGFAVAGMAAWSALSLHRGAASDCAQTPRP